MKTKRRPGQLTLRERKALIADSQKLIGKPYVERIAEEHARAKAS